MQEWRHAHGMRCLKVPNTRAFHNITKIQDALDLMERLKKENKNIEFDRETEEEYEDGAGNVLSKKTYQDLLRQGLL
jgi:splicing factor 3A subunit 3